MSSIPAAFAARAISSTVFASSCTRCSSACCSRATASARSLASNGSVLLWAPVPAPVGCRRAAPASRARSCARSLVRSPSSRADPVTESTAEARSRAAARVAARSSPRLGSRSASSALLPTCGVGALSQASARRRSVSPGNNPRRSASSSPCTMARSPTPLTSSESRRGSPTLPVWLTRQLTTWSRDSPWSSRTSITSGWRSDSGRVVSRPGTGTVTMGAESGTTRNHSSGGSPSSGAPSAVVTSSRQSPDAPGRSRPPNRAPAAERRATAAPCLHATAVSGTLAAPVVTITVPSGIRIVSRPGTRGSSARPR